MLNHTIQHKKIQPGAELSHKSQTSVAADQGLRCLKDNIIVEPLEAVYSAIIAVIHETKPLRGIVRAVGPGRFPKRYDHADKHKRTKMWESPVFQPTVVQVGDIVELGGAEHGGYSFQTFYWGDKLMILCREADVCGVLEHEND
jgi:co-chaperonin GroES (HSP10)